MCGQWLEWSTFSCVTLFHGILPYPSVWWMYACVFCVFWCWSGCAPFKPYTQLVRVTLLSKIMVFHSWFTHTYVGVECQNWTKDGLMPEFWNGFANGFRDVRSVHAFVFETIWKYISYLENSLALRKWKFCSMKRVWALFYFFRNVVNSAESVYRINRMA